MADSESTDYLGIKDDSQLLNFFFGIGDAVEKVLYSDQVLLVPLADAADAPAAPADPSLPPPLTPPPSQPRTLVVTDISVWCFPPMVEVEDAKFMVYSGYQRWLIKDLLLVSLPYHQKQGVAMRLDDFVLHLKGDQDVWLSTTAQRDRGIVVEVLCDLYEGLLGVPLDVQHPNDAELRRAILNHTLRTAIEDIRTEWWAHPEACAKAGWLWTCTVEQRKPAATANWLRGMLQPAQNSGGGEKRPNIDHWQVSTGPWKRAWWVLTRDGYLLEFRGPEEEAAVKHVLRTKQIRFSLRQGGALPKDFSVRKLNLEEGWVLTPNGSAALGMVGFQLRRTGPTRRVTRFFRAGGPDMPAELRPDPTVSPIAVRPASSKDRPHQSSPPAAAPSASQTEPSSSPSSSASSSSFPSSASAASPAKLTLLADPATPERKQRAPPRSATGHTGDEENTPPEADADVLEWVSRIDRCMFFQKEEKQSPPPLPATWTTPNAKQRGDRPFGSPPPAAALHEKLPNEANSNKGGVLQRIKFGSGSAKEPTNASTPGGVELQACREKRAVPSQGELSPPRRPALPSTPSTPSSPPLTLLP